MTSVLVLTLTVIVGLLGFLLVGLLRSHAEILRALHDLGVNLEDGARPGGTPTFAAVSGVDPGGRPRPGVDEAIRVTDGPESLGRGADLMGVTPSGEAAVVGIGAGSGGGLTLLAFLSSGCLTCEEFWLALGEGRTWRPDGNDGRTVIVTHGADRESPSQVAGLAPAGLTTLMSTEAYEDYGVPVSPYFVLVDGRDRRIVGEGAAGSWDQLVSLLAKAAADGGMGLGAKRGRREILTGRARSARVDAELEAAGIGPGDPSLYPDGALPEAVEPT